MALGFSPLKIQTLTESQPRNARFLVCGLAVFDVSFACLSRFETIHVSCLHR